MGVGAAIAGGVLGAGASIYAANSAANAQKNAAQNAINESNKMYGQAQQQLQPYTDFGKSNISTLGNLLSPNSATAQATLSGLPGYQFARDQGLQAVQSGAAARGLGTSGAAMRGAADYTTGLANQYYFDNVNALQNAVNTGANAAGGMASAALGTGQSVANSLTGIGNAQAGAAMASGNAIGGMANNLSGMMLTNALMQNNGYGSLFGARGGGGIYGGSPQVSNGSLIYSNGMGG